MSFVSICVGVSRQQSPVARHSNVDTSYLDLKVYVCERALKVACKKRGKEARGRDGMYGPGRCVAEVENVQMEANKYHATFRCAPHTLVASFTFYFNPVFDQNFRRFLLPWIPPSTRRPRLSCLRGRQRLFSQGHKLLPRELVLLGAELALCRDHPLLGQNALNLLLSQQANGSKHLLG